MNFVNQIEHRPYPKPSSSWVMYQRWAKLLFAHWQLPPENVEPYIPNDLTLDTFNGRAWIGVVPFLMQGIRPRYITAAPWISNFAELNVRTYVVKDGKAGVFFFSLDAANPIGVFLGRNWYNLPYFNAAMPVEIEEEKIHYQSHRTHRNASLADFSATYQPTSDVFQSEKGTLDYFLTERYCLYTQRRNGQLMRGEIHHIQWPLQHVEAEIAQNTMSPIDLPNEKPLLHYVDSLDVVVWPLKQIT